MPSWKNLIVMFLLAVFCYAMFGAEIMYRYSPGVLAMIEHTTYFPPNTCRILNIKELKGTGVIMWGKINNNKNNTAVEHIWGVDSGGNVIDATCSAETCKTLYVCGAITISDYGIVSTDMFKGNCQLGIAEAKFISLNKYVDYALAANKFYDKYFRKNNPTAISTIPAPAKNAFTIPEK